MAFLFQKFQEAVRTLAKSPTFARDPRHLQFEADINRLFLYTSYFRLGREADEKDAEEIIDLATRASVADQQKQVQDNVHDQIKILCGAMDDVLIPEIDDAHGLNHSTSMNDSPSRRSGLSFAVGGFSNSSNQPVVVQTRSLSQEELSKNLREKAGYTLDIKPSLISHPEAGNGLFLSGQAAAGAVVAFYPGVIYSPPHYKYIPGYPKIDSNNSYLITRYDGLIINAQPWARGGQTREPWDGVSGQLPVDSARAGPTGMWKLLVKPGSQVISPPEAEVLERRNPLAFGHFANHPMRGGTPNVMVCPYDFLMEERDMRVYIPNVSFGSDDGIRMRRVGSFWFKSVSADEAGKGRASVLKTVLLVATRKVEDEELLLNYRLSNVKRRPSWYYPVDDEEDRKRWG